MVADLAPHTLCVAVFRPQIAPNVGNLARTCVAAGARLHLIRPFGFALDDRQLKRSGMDYWPRLRLSLHDDEAAFFRAIEPSRCWFFDSLASHDLFDVPFIDGDVLCLGSETRGIDPKILREFSDRTVRIPQAPGERCLNLATSGGIALYAALAKIRQRSCEGTTPLKQAVVAPLGSVTANSAQPICPPLQTPGRAKILPDSRHG